MGILGKRTKPILAVFAVGVALIYFANNNAKKVVHSSNSDATYVKAMYSAPLTLDPAQMVDTASLVVSNLIYGGLLGFNEDLEVRPEIAESWHTSLDGRTLSFDLKTNARFSDGTPITSLDVVHSLTRLVAPASKVFSYYDSVKGARAYHLGYSKSVSGIRAPTWSRVEIELEHPFPPFLSILAWATAKILPPGSKNADFFKQPVSSGLFKYVRSEKRGERTDLLLSRNTFSPTTVPLIENLRLAEMTEVEASSEAAAGRVHDLASFPLSGSETVFQRGNESRSPVAATWIIGLNSRLPPFNEPNVRRHFRDAISGEEFRKLFHPDAIPAYGYIPPGLPGYLKKSSRDLTKLNGSVNTRQAIQVVIPNALAKNVEMKSYLESSLRAKGWKVDVVPMEWASLMEGYSGKRLQAFLVSMNMDYPDTEFLVRNFESNNPDNFSGLKNPEVDSLIREARSTRDRVRRKALYVKLVGLLDENAVTVNLFHPRGHYWINPCVKGFSPNILGDVYIDYGKISLSSGCSGKELAQR